MCGRSDEDWVACQHRQLPFTFKSHKSLSYTAHSIPFICVVSSAVVFFFCEALVVIIIIIVLRKKALVVLNSNTKTEENPQHNCLTSPCYTHVRQYSAMDNQIHAVNSLLQYKPLRSALVPSNSGSSLPSYFTRAIFGLNACRAKRATGKGREGKNGGNALFTFEINPPGMHTAKAVPCPMM